MSKSCSICKLTTEALNRIDEMLGQGVGHKKIATAISEDFLPISESALNRHLKNCADKQKEGGEIANRFVLLKEKANGRPLKSTDVYQAVCNLLSEEIERFIDRGMKNESLAKVTSNRINNLKELELLINMMMKLYPDIKVGMEEELQESALYITQDEFIELLTIRQAHKQESQKSPVEADDIEKLKKEIDRGQRTAITLEEVRKWVEGEEIFGERGLKIMNPHIEKLLKSQKNDNN